MVTGWTQKHWDLDKACPKISLYIVKKVHRSRILRELSDMIGCEMESQLARVCTLVKKSTVKNSKFFESLSLHGRVLHVWFRRSQQLLTMLATRGPNTLASI